MQALFPKESSETEGGLSPRLRKVDIVKTEAQAKELYDQYPFPAEKFPLFFQFVWRQYLGVMLDVQEVYSDQHSDASFEGFLLFFEEVLSNYTPDNIIELELFEADFDLRFYRGFTSLSETAKRDFMILKVAGHIPGKYVKKSLFLSTIAKDPDQWKDDDLIMIQQNIEKYRENVTYEEVDAIYEALRKRDDEMLALKHQAEFEMKTINPHLEDVALERIGKGFLIHHYGLGFGRELLDLRVFRQLDETLWMLEAMGMTPDQVEKYFRVFREVEKMYRQKFRKAEKSRYAPEKEEPFVNHLLRVTDLIFASLNKQKNRSPQNPLAAQMLAKIANDPNEILILALSALFHDSLEDNLRRNGHKFAEEDLTELLSKCDIPFEVMLAVRRDAVLLNFKKAMPGEPVDADGKLLNYNVGLERLQQEGAERACFIKGAGDIPQNTCSPHKAQISSSDWAQFDPRYKDKFGATNEFLEPFRDIWFHFPKEVKTRMQSNRQLIDLGGFFKDFYTNTTDLATKIREQVMDITDQKSLEPKNMGI